MGANDTQVGGTHYASTYQHWDLVAECEMGYFAGQITKYAARAPLKNGPEDLRKALHFCRKYAEVLELRPQLGMSRVPAHYCKLRVDKFLEANALPAGVAHIVACLALTHTTDDVLRCEGWLENLLPEEPAPRGYTDQDR